jgi:hypothetical protein
MMGARDSASKLRLAAIRVWSICERFLEMSFLDRAAAHC